MVIHDTKSALISQKQDERNTDVGSQKQRAFPVIVTMA